MNIALHGLLTLHSPLSHIGETISTTAYLNQEPIVQEDGSTEDVFVYNGNAWRGQLRDCAAVYMLDALAMRLPVDSFHLLFSGGRIGGDQSVNIERTRLYRRTIPLIAVWGGGIGNQILPGKLAFCGNAYPLCVEALPVLDESLHATASQTSYKALTFLKSFSRKDDSKDDRLTVHLAGSDPALGTGQLALLDAPAKPDKREGPADQMRMTVELLAAGTRLAHRLILRDISTIDLGCLVSALTVFGRAPQIGGQGGKGHGAVTVSYTLTDLETGEVRPFVTVGPQQMIVSPEAAAARAEYDALLAEYRQALSDRQGHIAQLLGVA